MPRFLGRHFSVVKVKVSIAKSPAPIFANRVSHCSFAESTTNHFTDFSGALVWLERKENAALSNSAPHQEMIICF